MAGPARAQSDTRAMADRMERLEREVTTLERQVYRGDNGGTVITSPAASPPSTSPSALIGVDDRLNQLEGIVRDLTGKVEEQTFLNRQLGTRLDKMQADLELRLSDIEKRTGGASPAPVAGLPPAPMPMAPAPAAPAGNGAARPPADGPFASDLAPHSLGTVPEKDVKKVTMQAAPPSPPAAAPPLQPATAAAPPAPIPTGSPQEMYQAAYGFLGKSEWDNAERGFKAFLEKYPADALAGNAKYWLGETYFVRGDFQNAAVQFIEGYQKYPKGAKAPDSLLKGGMSLSALNQKKEACQAFHLLQDRFPDAPDPVKRKLTSERQRAGC